MVYISITYHRYRLNSCHFVRCSPLFFPYLFFCCCILYKSNELYTSFVFNIRKGLRNLKTRVHLHKSIFSIRQTFPQIHTYIHPSLFVGLLFHIWVRVLLYKCTLLCFLFNIFFPIFLLHSDRQMSNVIEFCLCKTVELQKSILHIYFFNRQKIFFFLRSTICKAKQKRFMYQIEVSTQRCCIYKCIWIILQMQQQAHLRT